MRDEKGRKEGSKRVTEEGTEEEEEGEGRGLGVGGKDRIRKGRRQKRRAPEIDLVKMVQDKNS